MGAEQEAEKGLGNLARRSVIPVTLTLNRRHRNPGPSSSQGF
jgi:hypothetical protein